MSVLKALLEVRFWLISLYSLSYQSFNWEYALEEARWLQNSGILHQRRHCPSKYVSRNMSWGYVLPVRTMIVSLNLWTVRGIYVVRIVSIPAKLFRTKITREIWREFKMFMSTFSKVRKYGFLSQMHRIDGFMRNTSCYYTDNNTYLIGSW